MRTFLTNFPEHVWIEYKKKSRILILNFSDIVFWHYLINKKDKIWFKNGKIHRRKDRPALERENGDKIWFQNNRRHRARNKPAIISANQDRFYFFKGKKYVILKEDEKEEIHIVCSIFKAERLVIHSVGDKPARVYSNGTKEWHDFGKLHRSKKPAVIYKNGDQEWWKFGERHRSNGPAVIYGNKNYYFENGNFIKMETT